MAEEVNYKKNFCEKYFEEGTWELDVLNEVDVLLKDQSGNKLLYIEAKYQITTLAEHRQALAQVILTNKKQEAILSYVALIYKNRNEDDVLELIDCSEDAVMYNNDFNWKVEKPSSPSKDAINRINDRLIGKISQYKNEEIKELYKQLKQDKTTQIQISVKNLSVVYNHWKDEIKFNELIRDEQDIINIFLVDTLNNAKYTESVYDDVLGKIEKDLIREGTKLNSYAIVYNGDGELDGIRFLCSPVSFYYSFADKNKYESFWKKYKRPPVKEEFLKILEHSSLLYSDKYRRDTGGEYTPTCFVEKQNEILAKYYNMDEFIVMDPCCGVGNLENQFGKEYKQYCYLSTLEQIDVDTCFIKGFNNVVKYDYFSSKQQPYWKYKGQTLSINEICMRENRKLMVVMNPPYQNKKEFDNNLAIEFFNKVVQLKPQVIVFYYMTESFLREEIDNYIKSDYGIVSHIFSNAKTTFGLSTWPISMVIFDKDNSNKVNKEIIKADRYEYNKKDNRLDYIQTYIYNNSKPNLFKEMQQVVKDNQKGMTLGNFSYIHSCINLTNKVSKNQNRITTQNLKYCLLSKGLCFNTDAKYFEWNDYIYKGKIKKISDELFSDAIMFSVFFKGCAFTNKGQNNYIMPFTSDELQCPNNALNVLFPQDYKGDVEDNIDEQPFDFRNFFHSFKYSSEAMNLYNSALKVFKYYHNNNDYQNKDWNDGFYDITNAIMGKDNHNFELLDTDTRIVKTKTTKGTRGFGRNTIRQVVAEEYLPIFEEFFDARDILAKKINKQLVEQEILLWERENIY